MLGSRSQIKRPVGVGRTEEEPHPFAWLGGSAALLLLTTRGRLSVCFFLALPLPVLWGLPTWLFWQSAGIIYFTLHRCAIK